MWIALKKINRITRNIYVVEQNWFRVEVKHINIFYLQSFLQYCIEKWANVSGMSTTFSCQAGKTDLYYIPCMSQNYFTISFQKCLNYIADIDGTARKHFNHLTFILNKLSHYTVSFTVFINKHLKILIWHISFTKNLHNI